MKTLDKIDSFLKLDQGWHFGKGVPASEKVADIATKLINMASMSVFDTDAFPGIDGEIMVTIYHKEHYIEFTVEVDGSITYAYQFGDEDELLEEGLTFNEAKMKLDQFSEKIWNLHESCIVVIGTQKKRTSRASHSETPPQVESPLYPSNVLRQPEGIFANIFANFTNGSHPSPRYTGSSRSKFYQSDAVLSNIVATPETTAMAIYAG